LQLPIGEFQEEHFEYILESFADNTFEARIEDHQFHIRPRKNIYELFEDHSLLAGKSLLRKEVGKEKDSEYRAEFDYENDEDLVRNDSDCDKADEELAYQYK